MQLRTLTVTDRDNKQALLTRAARWYVRRRVASKTQIRARLGAVAETRDKPEEVAIKLQRKEGHKAAMRGFLTGLGSSPYTAIPLALLNLDGATAQQLNYAAGVGLLYDPRFFERDNWELDVLRAMVGIEATGVASGMGTSALAGAAVKRFAIRRAKKTGIRVATNFVPIVGGLAGAVAEHLLLTRAAKSIRQQFESELEHLQ